MVNNFIRNKDTVTKKMPNVLDGFVNFVCHWKTVKESVDYLKNGNAVVDVNQKWDHYGKFLAKVIDALGSR
jgi:hypothetical protein